MNFNKNTVLRHAVQILFICGRWKKIHLFPASIRRRRVITVVAIIYQFATNVKFHTLLANKRNAI